MTRIRFLSYLVSIAKTEYLDLPVEQITVAEAIEFTILKIPQLKSYLEGIPEVLLIMNNSHLLLPRDLKLQVISELIISPVVKGG